MYLSYRTEKWYNGEKLEGEDMKINEIFTRETKVAAVTGAEVPETRICGSFEIVGFNPEINSVYVVDNGNHYFVNGIPAASSYSAQEWLFKTENNKVLDFITED